MANPASGAPATPTSGLSLPTSTGSSSASTGGKRCHMIPYVIKCLSCYSYVILLHGAHAFFSGNPLSFLRNQPQFHMMRQLIQQNASLLPALLQEIGRENPELLQVKHQHSLMCFILSHLQTYHLLATVTFFLSQPGRA